MPTKIAIRSCSALGNERITEGFIRELLRANEYYDPETSVRVEEQKSTIDSVKRLLRNASKAGTGMGYPEYIITSTAAPDFLVLIECKASANDHSSTDPLAAFSAEIDLPSEERKKRANRYAVDGALHYAAHLSREFNVVAIGASGQEEDQLLITTYLFTKGTPAPKKLVTRQGREIESILAWDDYIEHATFDPSIQRLRETELMAFSRELHEFMRDHAKLTESEKPLLVGGTLIALRDTAFATSYSVITPAENLQRAWYRAIQDQVNEAHLPQAKKESMVQPYSSIAVHPELGKPTKDYPRGVLHELIQLLHQKVWPFISIYHDFDIVGKFYGEFLKYTGGDKKALGIVLTPRHITEISSVLAEVDEASVVLDICAGTGGFLISAMHRMISQSQSRAEVDRIKSRGLVGVEQQPNMFALAASNMILRGDGKANLYQGSCFDPAITAAIKKHRATAGLLNPPFSQSDTDLHELRFTKHLLDCLGPNGKAVVVLPMGCAIGNSTHKSAILRDHSLDAVMSLPDELFYPVGTITCLMVFTAHKPHRTKNSGTWFGYWKDDGFVKTKHLGRIDQNGLWPQIRERWLSEYFDRTVAAGRSVVKKVTADDEWCAEAYMDTDYSLLKPDIYRDHVEHFLSHQLLSGRIEKMAGNRDKDS
ncbi:N-6 DNA methylase [Microbispora sp. NPDC049633]|uniref:HsdM family class I SAM-dependent methyltransferase n=1 Tax=Microbispora sp. NPDC049633 TaxID=3154355 RepID=UPI00343A6843